MSNVNSNVFRSAWHSSDAFDALGKFSFSNAGAVTLASLDSLLHLSKPLAEFSNDVTDSVLVSDDQLCFFFDKLRVSCVGAARTTIFTLPTCAAAKAASPSTSCIGARRRAPKAGA